MLSKKNSKSERVIRIFNEGLKKLKESRSNTMSLS